MSHAANPPLPFTNDAIIDRLRHQATNGPATSSTAQPKPSPTSKASTPRPNTKPGSPSRASRVALRDSIQDAPSQRQRPRRRRQMCLAKRMEGLNNGTLQPTPEELAHFEPDNPAQAEDDDEDHPEEQEDEPP